MICSCKWLTFNQLCDVVESGARSVADIQRCCGAGTECGGCVEMLEQMVQEPVRDTPATPVPLAPQADSSAA